MKHTYTLRFDGLCWDIVDENSDRAIDEAYDTEADAQARLDAFLATQVAMARAQQPGGKEKKRTTAKA